jgi:hypothetical protein
MNTESNSTTITFPRKFLPLVERTVNLPKFKVGFRGHEDTDRAVEIEKQTLVRFYNEALSNGDRNDPVIQVRQTSCSLTGEKSVVSHEANISPRELLMIFCPDIFPKTETISVTIKKSGEKLPITTNDPKKYFNFENPEFKPKRTLFPAPLRRVLSLIPETIMLAEEHSELVPQK